MADAAGLNPAAARRAGSNPALGITLVLNLSATMKPGNPLSWMPGQIAQVAELGTNGRPAPREQDPKWWEGIHWPAFLHRRTIDLADPHYVFYLSKHTSIDEARRQLYEIENTKGLALREVESEIVVESVANRILFGYQGKQPRIRRTSKSSFRKLLWLVTGAMGSVAALSSDDPNLAAVLGFIGGFAIMVTLHIWYELEFDW